MLGKKDSFYRKVDLFTRKCCASQPICCMQCWENVKITTLCKPLVFLQRGPYFLHLTRKTCARKNLRTAVARHKFQTKILANLRPLAEGVNTSNRVATPGMPHDKPPRLTFILKSGVRSTSNLWARIPTRLAFPCRNFCAENCVTS